MLETDEEKTVCGSCLCGDVAFELKPPFKLFQYCHCSRCQKTTGSAHTANIFVPSGQFKWLRGEECVNRYSLPEAKHYGTTFCQRCGSSLPWTSSDKKTTIVPAGGLDEPLSVSPVQSIYWGSKAEWYQSPCDLPVHAELPVKS